jgi:glyoxylase-like metal-dependent hydrolase (beta-lactamase superfamily II)
VDLKTPTIEIVAIDTPSLGPQLPRPRWRYAVVVDPQRDTDRVLNVVAAHGLRVTHVLETHIHNDYVTGGYALARQVGAAYVVSADDRVDYQRLAVHDNEVLEAGPRMRVRVLHTGAHLHPPGLRAGGRRPGGGGVFTGGSLLYGLTGRPDLLGAQHAETSACHQHASAHRLVRDLPADTPCLPDARFAASLGHPVRGHRLHPWRSRPG